MPSIQKLTDIEEVKAPEYSAAMKNAVRQAIKKHGLNRLKVRSELNKTLRPILQDMVIFNLRLGTKWLEESLKEVG